MKIDLIKFAQMDPLLNKAKVFVLKGKYAESFDLLNQADSKGDYLATYALATWYLTGRFVKRDSKKAFRFLSKATKGNIKEAFFDLGICYEIGEGITRNPTKAFESYLRASQLGDKNAMDEVVRCLYHGIGVERNRQMSKFLFDKIFKLNNHLKTLKTSNFIKRSPNTKRAMVA
jgi:uncharacterized protein